MDLLKAASRVVVRNASLVVTMDPALGTGPRARACPCHSHGPWQCSQRSMDSCRMECAAEGYSLKGCMWLADLKLDWKGQIVPPVRVDSGGRLAIVHCCCDYPRISAAQNRILREESGPWGIRSTGLGTTFEISSMEEHRGAPWNTVGPDLPYSDGR